MKMASISVLPALRNIIEIIIRCNIIEIIIRCSCILQYMHVRSLL